MLITRHGGQSRIGANEFSSDIALFTLIGVIRRHARKTAADRQSDDCEKDTNYTNCHEAPKAGVNCWIIPCEFVNGVEGTSDIEGKAATGSGERAGKGASFKFVSEKRSHSPLSLFSTSFFDIRRVLTIFQFPSASNFNVKRKLASESREPLPFQTA